MDNKIVVGIHQPNFMPWLGYFYKIYQSNIFIFLDDAQFPKTGGSYVNRVSIIINREKRFITAPVKRLHGTWKINETEFANNNWRKKIINAITINYSKAKFFKEFQEIIFNLINYDTNNICEFNINFIKNICNLLDINRIFYKSSTFKIEKTSTERLIALVKAVNGNVYLSGKGGDNYQDKELFQKNNIELRYNILPQFEYIQYGVKNFIPGLSIIDAIFNIGIKELKKRLFR